MMENAIAEASIRPRHIRIVATTLAIAGSVGLLMVISRGPEPEYYKQVHEITARPQDWSGRHLVVHGWVVPGSIERARGTQHYRFRIESPSPSSPGTLNVVYSGEVPDTFCSSAEVILKGTLTRDGILDVVPDGIMTACASKYVYLDCGAKPGPAAWKMRR
jgi:cytochrome c-type biogenesis protein CcmE